MNREELIREILYRDIERFESILDISTEELLPKLEARSIHLRDKRWELFFEYLVAPDKFNHYDVAKSLTPWRKGPFELEQYTIDSEWRSDLKWNRVRPYIDRIQDLRILDVGGGNGYYQIEIEREEPRVVVGIDPSVLCLLQYRFLERFIPPSSRQFFALTLEEFNAPAEFDLVLCMGILYHRRNPLDTIARCRSLLKPGGTFIVETQVIIEEGCYALFPQGRYGKSPNVFFLPTADCLLSWINRSGFEVLEHSAAEYTTTEEQRSTDWMQFESLGDFLDRDDSTKTVEGHPAPARMIVKARKKK